jgi:alpha,alpha-trehalose phosphorylase
MAAFHVNAAIADAVRRYVLVSGDLEFERRFGLELLVDTARLWRSLGHWRQDGGFGIDGVTGPDEYSAVVDNNVYTNLMAQANLRAAAAAAERHPAAAQALSVSEKEVGSWREAADGMLIPYDEALGLHPQDQDFLSHEVWDFDSTPPDKYPLLLSYTYFDLYRKQVIKQADLVLALHRRSSSFTSEQKRRDFDYYETMTVRDSSLSAATQAIVAAEVGHLDLALDYLAVAAFTDLHDLSGNIGDGLHIASLSGAALAVIAGLGGLRDDGEVVSFSPRLPAALPRVAFGVTLHGAVLRIELTPGTVTYALTGDAAPVRFLHDGEPVDLQPGATTTRRMHVTEQPPRPRQPVHRAPPRWPYSKSADADVADLRAGEE